MIGQTSTKDLTSLIDHASQASDRWMFIALLVIGLMAIGMLGRYFAKRHEVLEGKLDEMQRFIRENFTSMVAKSEAALSKSSEVIEDNTAVLEESKSILWSNRAAKAVGASGPVTGVVLALALVGCATVTPEERAQRRAVLGVVLRAVGQSALQIAVAVAQSEINARGGYAK